MSQPEFKGAEQSREKERPERLSECELEKRGQFKEAR